MISDISKLNKVKKIVTHAYCHDGTTSAMILKDVLHDAEIFFAEHKALDYLNLPVEEGLLFCDITPPPDREQEFLDAGSIVLDHHIKTKDIVKKFEEAGLGVYGENDLQESGAVLAHKHVWMPLQHQAKTPKEHVCELARLAGIRDTFHTTSIEWDEAVLQAEVVTFYPVEYFLTDHQARILPEEKHVGRFVYKKKQDDNIVKNIANSAVIISWEDKNIGIIPGHRVISDVAEELRQQGIQVTFSFKFKTDDFGYPTVSYSIRSDGSFDCNKFAFMKGGGGHTQAAGSMTFKIEDETLNPYSLIHNYLNLYGKECLL